MQYWVYTWMNVVLKTEIFVYSKNRVNQGPLRPFIANNKRRENKVLYLWFWSIVKCKIESEQFNVQKKNYTFFWLQNLCQKQYTQQHHTPTTFSRVTYEYREYIKVISWQWLLCYKEFGHLYTLYNIKTETETRFKT